MTCEEIDKVLGIEGKEVWKPDFDYGEEISEEENEEITRLLESLTEDDLKIARIDIVDRWTGKTKQIIYVDD